MLQLGKSKLPVSLTLIVSLIIGSMVLITSSHAQESSSGAIVLTQAGAPIKGGANGLFFDSNDRLYIASVIGKSIYVMDPDTGEILDQIGQERGVANPDDVTIGPDGSVYWTDILSGTVGRLAPDGETTKQFVAPGVNPIAFNNEGQLFVALDFLGDALYELDPNLQDEPRLITENLGNFNAFDFGPNGFLWGPLFSKGTIAMVVPGSGTINEIFVEGGFVVPVAVKFNSKNELYVLDLATGEIAIVDPLLGTKQVIATLEPALDNLAFDSNDRLFVSNNTTGAIFEVLSNGSVRVVSPGGLIAPGGVAVLTRPDGGETVVIADVQSLRGLDSQTGEQLFLIPGLPNPFTVAVAGNQLIATSWFANAVIAFDLQAGQVVEAHFDFAVPLNAIRFQGDLVVAELVGQPGAARVTRANGANPSERIIIADASKNIFVPTGLAATDNDLWVADWATGTVWQLIADGQTLEQPIPVAGELAQPEGLAVAPDGSLLVVEAGAGRLSQIDLDSGVVNIIAEGLELGATGPEGFPPTWLFNGVTVGASGVIYVSGDRGNVLHRIIKPFF